MSEKFIHAEAEVQKGCNQQDEYLEKSLSTQQISSRYRAWAVWFLIWHLEP